MADDDVDTIVTSATRRPEIRLVREGRSLPPAEYCTRKLRRVDSLYGTRLYSIAGAMRGQVLLPALAFDPIPGAWSRLGETELKLFGARPSAAWARRWRRLATRRRDVEQ